MLLLIPCRRGEVCSHVAAVLFKVETACRLGYTKPTCTSLPCAWNQSFSSKVSYLHLHCIVIISALFYRIHRLIQLGSLISSLSSQVLKSPQKVQILQLIIKHSVMNSYLLIISTMLFMVSCHLQAFLLQCLLLT